jgi:hypothetical protein
VSQPDASHAESGVPSEELRTKAQELLSHIELLDIRPLRLAASIEEGVSPGAHVTSVNMDLAISFAADTAVYGGRFDYSFLLKGDPAGEVVGQVEFSLLVEYNVDEDFTPDVEAAAFVTRTTGYFAAYPYARELFQSLTSRLQFDPIVIGLIKRDTMKPGAVSIATRSALISES